MTLMLLFDVIVFYSNELSWTQLGTSTCIER